METLRLIVGLGNPGSQYALTRHNVGFMAVELLGSQHRAGWRLEGRFESQLAWVQVQGNRVLLCQPHTFMNLSGRAVRKILDYYKIAKNRLLVVVDDADLQLGGIRLREFGSSGGHHGLESIEENISGRDYARVRIGIGRKPGSAEREISNYVLGRFEDSERGLVELVLKRVTLQIERWITDGSAKAMNDFNGVIRLEPPIQQES